MGFWLFISYISTKAVEVFLFLALALRLLCHKNKRIENYY